MKVLILFIIVLTILSFIYLFRNGIITHAPSPGSDSSSTPSEEDKQAEIQRQSENIDKIRSSVNPTNESMTPEDISDQLKSIDRLRELRNNQG